MLTSMLRRIRFPVLAMALTAPIWSSCQAAGSFQTRPAFSSDVSTDDPGPPPASTWPGLSAEGLVGGCGKGRVSDPETHGCRGPADIGIWRHEE
jgi:hypothetical protein